MSEPQGTARTCYDDHTLGDLIEVRKVFGLTKRQLRRRLGIQPVIDHMKTDGPSAAVTSKAATLMRQHHP